MAIIDGSIEIDAPAELAFKCRAETTEVIPGKRIAWNSVPGSVNAGVVNFHDLLEGSCLVTLHLVVAPKGLIENIGRELGVVDRLVDRVLVQFKEHVEKIS